MFTVSDAYVIYIYYLQSTYLYFIRSEDGLYIYNLCSCCSIIHRIHRHLTANKTVPKINRPWEAKCEIEWFGPRRKKESSSRG